MKWFGLMSICILGFAFAPVQNKKYAHGMVFGTKPDYIQLIEAAKLDSTLGKRTRISSAVRGRVISVKKSKGGWFDIDAGNGKVIAAHFNKYNINLPADLKGHRVIASGVIQRPINQAAMQHFAGDKTKAATRAKSNISTANQPITMVVTGVMVD